MSVYRREEKVQDEIKIIHGCYIEDPKAQELLYRKYYGYSMGICLRYSSNEDDAMELVNDSWLKIFRNMKKFHVGKKIKPWIRSIIVNTAIDKYRIRMNVQTEFLTETNAPVFQEDILDHLSVQDLLKTVNALPEMYRFVFNLYVIEGYSHREIAKKLKIKQSTSRSYLTRAKEQLKKEILKLIAYEEVIPR